MKKIAVALGTLFGLAILAGIVVLVIDSRRDSTAMIHCREVNAGMTRAEALQRMGNSFIEQQSDGEARLLFEASAFVDTVPQVYVDLKTDKVTRTECP